MSRRLKLRPTVYCTPVRDGLYFAGWTEAFTLQGPPSLRRLAEVVLPLLEDGVPEGELLAALPEGAARAVTEKLVAELLERRMLLDLDTLSVPALPAELLARYGDTVAHLEGTSDDPYAAFLRFRGARIAVLGDGEAALRCAGLLTTLGLDEPVRDDLDEPVDLVVDLATVAGIGLSAATAATARRRGLPLVQGVATGTAGIVCGPLAGDAQPGLTDAVARAAQRRAAGLPAPELAGEPAPVLVALVAGLAAHRAFQWLTGTGRDLARASLADGDTLAVTEHLVVPTTDRPADGAFGSVTVEAFLDAARDVADDAFGVLGAASPWGLPQTPAFATAVRAGAAGTLYGFGLSEEESRYRAYAEALRALAGEGAAFGLDVASLRLDGVARQALADWLAAGTPGTALDYTGVADDATRMCWKTLAVRHGRAVAVVTAEPLPGVACAAVRADGVRTAAYGVTPTRAARDALVAALGAAQAGLSGPYLAGWADGPVVPGIADDDPPKPAEVLDRLGLDVRVTPSGHPAVAASGALAGHVEVRHG
ncbi:MAG TPA: hypothetical protein VNA20_14080 [Frankiaceae bacterium]|nr:hypothetical protein [Frankiaceae bacterium]